MKQYVLECDYNLHVLAPDMIAGIPSASGAPTSRSHGRRLCTAHGTHRTPQLLGVFLGLCLVLPSAEILYLRLARKGTQLRVFRIFSAGILQGDMSAGPCQKQISCNRDLEAIFHSARTAYL